GDAVAVQVELVLRHVGAGHGQPVLLVGRGGDRNWRRRLDDLHRVDAYHPGYTLQRRDAAAVDLDRQAVEQARVGVALGPRQAGLLGVGAEGGAVRGERRRVAAVGGRWVRQLDEPAAQRSARADGLRQRRGRLRLAGTRGQREDGEGDDSLHVNLHQHGLLARTLSDPGTVET